jgi:hypothetical protein
VPDAIVFLPLPARRALQAIHEAYPRARLEIERRGPIRRPVRATLHVEEPVEIEVLTDRELSAELRRRRDRSLDPLAAVRVPRPWATRIAEVTGGRLHVEPVARGLAVSALVARAQLESEQWDGRESEPQRLLAWLRTHGADAALTEEELGWLEAPVDELPAEATAADLAGELTALARQLRLVDELESVDVPGLLHAFGILQDELPGPLRR